MVSVWISRMLFLVIRRRGGLLVGSGRRIVLRVVGIGVLSFVGVGDNGGRGRVDGLGVQVVVLVLGVGILVGQIREDDRLKNQQDC